jgi:hypothetical protein
MFQTVFFPATTYLAKTPRNAAKTRIFGQSLIYFLRRLIVDCSYCPTGFGTKGRVMQGNRTTAEEPIDGKRVQLNNDGSLHISGAGFQLQFTKEGTRQLLAFLTNNGLVIGGGNPPAGNNDDQ